MIRYLQIQRLAVIDQLELEFGPGLSVLTGETGAGKSILVEAVGLLLGARATADLVRTGSDTAIVQAVIDTPDGREVLVRREVSAQGRSRAFIDGHLVTTTALRDAMADLVDLHGQHEHQALLSPQTQLACLDRFASLDPLREEVSGHHAAWAAARQALADARTANRDRAARLDLLEFQRHEIDKVAPLAGEDATLDIERRVAANADRLGRLCSESYASLYDNDGAVLSQLGQVWKRVGELAALDPRFAPFLDSRASIDSQLEDLAFLLRDYASSIEGAADRLQALSDRLAQVERLKQRYGPTLDEVLARRREIEDEFGSLGNSAERIAALEEAESAARRAYLDAAKALSKRRRQAAPALTASLVASLRELAMPGTVGELVVDSAPEAEDRWTSNGVDRVELLLSPNPGEDMRPLNRIASGGELSRVMLAIKTLASADAPGKTLIFDEVDAGIGGRVAAIVGDRLRSLAATCQVLCITHLPQVAAGGRSHFLVVKQIVGDRTVTEVRSLSSAQRVEEIARMMGGREVTSKVREGAQDLLAAYASRGPDSPPERPDSAPSSPSSERRKAKAKAR
jgi:DNA repair protein RecN (Recombination protein N)